MLTFAHRWLLLMALTLTLAAPAGAAEVARIDSAGLHARDDRRAGGFCLQVSETRVGGGGGGTCGPAPWRPRRSMVVTWVAKDRVVLAGAVPAGVARAEVELVDGRRTAVDTVAGPRYRGRHAGRLRFFLAALPLADPRDDEAGGLLAVRFLGQDGTLGRARVTALRFGGRRVAFPLLPAARQCGYRVYAPGFGQAESELELRSP